MHLLYFDSQERLCLLDAEGVRVIDAEHVARLRGDCGLLLPGAAVWLSRAQVPGKQRQRVLQAIPYALEEHLLDDVEELHFAVGQRDAQGRYPVAVTRRQQMDAIVARLQSYALSPTLILSEVLAVPRPPDGWGVLLLADRALVRSADDDGFAVERDNLAHDLSLALLEKNRPLPERIWLLRGEADNAGLLSAANTQGIEIIERSRPGDALLWLCEGALNGGARGLNLLQGAYQAQSALLLHWRPWRLSLVLLLLWGLLHTALIWQEQRALAAEARQLQQAMHRLYRQHFPDARRIINPRVQMEQQLKQLRGQQQRGAGQAQFLALLERVAAVLRPQAGLRMERLDFRDGLLDLDLSLDSVQRLEQLQQGLSELGLTVEIRNASSRNERVESQLRIREGGA